MTVRFHLFPFRTQQLSSLVPKIVSWKRLVKIGSRRLEYAALRALRAVFFLLSKGFAECGADPVLKSVKASRTFYRKRAGLFSSIFPYRLSFPCAFSVTGKSVETIRFCLYDTIFCPKTQQKSPEIFISELFVKSATTYFHKPFPANYLRHK